MHYRPMKMDPLFGGYAKVSLGWVPAAALSAGTNSIGHIAKLYQWERM
jgi:hypothetical protein